MGRGPLGFKGTAQPKTRKHLKAGTSKSTITRRSANGESCTIRGPGCLHDTGTVALDHIRRGNMAGMAEKPKDYLGVYGCRVCHANLDGVGPHHISDADLLRAHCETLMVLEAKGILVIKE